MVLSNLALPSLWTDFKILRMYHFKRKEKVHGKLACQKKRCINKLQWWMKHSKYHPRDIYPEWPLGTASFFLDKMGWATFLRRSQMLTLFLFLANITTEENLSCESPAFSQSVSRHWYWLRAGQFKNILAFLTVCLGHGSSEVGVSEWTYWTGLSNQDEKRQI